MEPRIPGPHRLTRLLARPSSCPIFNWQVRNIGEILNVSANQGAASFQRNCRNTQVVRAPTAKLCPQIIESLNGSGVHWMILNGSNEFDCRLEVEVSSFQFLVSSCGAHLRESAPDEFFDGNNSHEKLCIAGSINALAYPSITARQKGKGV
ncbi:MAG: hypothetical protein ACI8UO_003573 [Verrucomicrobiales bacterium]